MSCAVAINFDKDSDDMDQETQTMKRKRDECEGDSPIQGNSPSDRDVPAKRDRQLEDKQTLLQTPVVIVRKTHVDASIDNAEHIVYIKGRSSNITLIKPDLIRKDINDQFSVVKKIEKAGQSLRVICASDSQKKRLLRGNVMLAGISVVVSEPRSTQAVRPEIRTDRSKQIKVVAGGVPLGITDEEMRQESGATTAKRMFKRGPQGSEPTLSVLLTYSEGASIPDKVYIDYLFFKVRPFVATPIRCFKCQRFGHVTSSCRSQKTACPTCGGGHTFETCPNKESPHCTNCGGTHSAAYKKCVRYTEVKETLKIVSYERLSYRDALAKVKATALVQTVRAEQQHAPAAAVPVPSNNEQLDDVRNKTAVITQTNNIEDQNTVTVEDTTVTNTVQIQNQVQEKTNTVTSAEEADPHFGIDVFKFVKLFVKLVNLIVTTDDKSVLKSAALELAMDTLEITEEQLGVMVNRAT